MATKRKPENDLVVTSSAAAAQPRRTTARPKHSKTTVDTPEAKVVKSAGKAVAAASASASEPSQEEIRALAHSYWEARGCQGGSPEEDWRRAEEQLRLQTSAAI